MYYVGSVYPWLHEVEDANGNPTNVSTITLTVTKPDLTTATPPVSNPPADQGRYRLDYALDQEGPWTFETVTTGPTTADSVTIVASRFRSLLSIAEAKRVVNDTGDLQLDELREKMAAATSKVEDIVGPILPRTVTETRTAKNGTLALMVFPVLAVITVTRGTIIYGPSSLTVDTEAGLVKLGSGYLVDGYDYTVTYVAGRRIVPPHYREAVVAMLEDLWLTQRGAHSDQLAPDLTDAAVFTDPGFGGGGIGGQPSGVPLRVLRLLNKTGGFA